MKRPQSLDNSLNDVKYEQYINNLHDRLPSLVEPDDIDKNRWPWELVQNAKDTVVHRPLDARYVDVKFRYFWGEDGQKKLQFEHNGNQFTDKAITGLIWKFSAEKRDETTEDGLSRDKQSTGRFGTGFMTTHALSLTVDVSGSMYNGDEGVKRNVSVDFTLHREGPSDQDYRDGVNRTEEEMRFDEREVRQGTELPTIFTYHLRNEINEQAAETGLNNVRLNAAQTMLFCPTIRSISIDDAINNRKFKISRQSTNDKKDVVKETIFTEESSEKGSDYRRFISIEVDEPSSDLSNYWKIDNRHLRLHVAVEVDDGKCILPILDTSPSVYCALPLIGFEKMTLPFYINSNDFEPKTERTSLFLNQRRTKIDYDLNTNQDFEVIIQNGVNWSILERSIKLYNILVDYLIANNYNNRYNLINGLNKVLKGSWTEEERNCLASRFVLPLRKMLVDKELVKTNKGYRSLSSNVKIIYSSKDKNSEEFYDICTSIYGAEMTIKEENHGWINMKWSKYLFPSEFAEKTSADDNPVFPIIDYDNVTDFIEKSESIDKLELVEGTDKLSWLNKFYRWIYINQLSLLTEKAIVPNRLGDFCKCDQSGELKDASDIPTGVFDFMKTIQLDWDKYLLMNGVENVIIPEETTNNIVSAIKKRSEEIINGNNNVLEQLMPLLLALPKDADDKMTKFLDKRSQIVSIISDMYRDQTNGIEATILDLDADTWKSADEWFMKYVVQVIADRKVLDDFSEDEHEQNNRDRFCTAMWLSNTVKFMFENGYLHLEDVTSKDNGECLSILPNRYGFFKPLDKLYKQGEIPNQLLNNILSKTGFDIKGSLLYDGFILSDRIPITEYSLSMIATKYNSFFDNNEVGEEEKEIVASYLIHLIPNSGDQYSITRELYDKYKHTEERLAEIISISDLSIWKGANAFLIAYLAKETSEKGTVELLGKHLEQQNNTNVVSNVNSNLYFKEGLNWLNKLSYLISSNKVDINDNLKLIPDWYGTLQCKKNMSYNGSRLKQYSLSEMLIDIADGELWNHISPEEDLSKEKGIVKKIVHPDYCFVEDYPNNTCEAVFGLVDKMIDYCLHHESADWRSTLKRSIETLLNFFDKNDGGCEDSILDDLFKRTYHRRKEFAWDYVYDRTTKETIAEINDSFSFEEIKEIIKEHALVKEILNNKEHYENLEDNIKGLQAEIEELKRRLNQRSVDIVDDESYADMEEGVWGEAIVWEELKKEYPEDDGYRVIWASRDENEPRYDFRIEKNEKVVSYYDAKTTNRGLGNSDSIPFFMRKSQWLFLQNLGDSIPYYVARVFMADNNSIRFMRISIKESGDS